MRIFSPWRTTSRTIMAETETDEKGIINKPVRLVRPHGFVRKQEAPAPAEQDQEESLAGASRK